MSDHQGQLDHEGRAAPFPRTLGEDDPPVELDEMAHEREPEPQPAVGPRTAAIALAETVEDEREKLRRDPLSRIADEQLDMRADLLQLDLDPPALRRELHRVAQEVPCDLLQPVDRKSTRLNSSHGYISYAVFCLKKKKKKYHKSTQKKKKNSHKE